MPSFFSRHVFVFFVFAAAACSATVTSTDPGPLPGSDAGPSHDGGGGGDAAPAPEASVPEDGGDEASSRPDGSAIDARPPDDAQADVKNPTDVAGTPECDAFCAWLQQQCPGYTCIEAVDCRIQSGQCAASERAYLGCIPNPASSSQAGCDSMGYAIITSCSFDTSVCH
jgi:hypothetical protein